MAQEKKFDVVIIGSGPGGYVCAIRAAQLGKKVAIVERENLGGICLNWGCIPTKALLKTSEMYMDMTKKAADFGFTKVQTPEFDMKKLIGRSRDVAGKLAGGVEYLMKKNSIEVIKGEGRFTAQGELTVFDGKKEKHKVEADDFVIATGARAREIPGVLETDDKNIWTYRHAMTPEKMPTSIIIIGGGAIGIEFASFYAAFGVNVTVVEAQDRILPVEDEEISKLASKSFRDRGIELITSASVKELHSTKTGASAKIDKGGKEELRKAEKALIAIGVQGNTENLGLEDIGVKVERGEIQVDGHYRTGAGGVWAIGDVIGTPWLAHVASHEGIHCAEAIAGKNPDPMDYGNVPGCTYCYPQVASVGMTEAQAKSQAKSEGGDIKVGRFNYQANGKAIAAGEDFGLVKTIFDSRTGALLGAHIIGADATEMISTFVLGRSVEVTEQDFINTCLPHPTLSEMMGESVLDSAERVLHA